MIIADIEFTDAQVERLVELAVGDLAYILGSPELAEEENLKLAVEDATGLALRVIAGGVKVYDLSHLGDLADEGEGDEELADKLWEAYDLLTQES